MMDPEPTPTPSPEPMPTPEGGSQVATKMQLKSHVAYFLGSLAVSSLMYAVLVVQGFGVQATPWG